MAWNDIPEWAVAASRAIMQAVELKDPETAAHCVRVGRGSRLLAKAAGLDVYSQRVCEFAGLFHDVGKVGVPDHILFKPGKLDEAEYVTMQGHPEMSVKIVEPLSSSAFIKDLLPGIRHHHERYDGKGYPDGVSGEEIPLESRIILIADTFDAMTATRAYRKGLPAEAAYAELALHAARQFDARLVEIFLKAQPKWKAEEQDVAEEFQACVFRPAA